MSIDLGVILQDEIIASMKVEFDFLGASESKVIQVIRVIL